VKRYRKGTPELFWAAFSSADGKKLTYTLILERLAKERTARYKQLSMDARMEYGDRFNNIFSYTKGGQCMVKSRTCDIAKQYCEMKGLAADDEDEDDE
jgi:hypothetical protein